MEKQALQQLLNEVAKGALSPEAAIEEINVAPDHDLGFARADTMRSLRQGFGEVIYGEGKTKEQIAEIAAALMQNGQQTVLVTRCDADKAAYVLQTMNGEYDAISRALVLGELPPKTGKGKVVVVCAGTSDLYCAKEAAITAEACGNEVACLFDVGVAGIHRLLDCVELLREARVVVAVAGMEGALASVVGGLVSCPVIAVPTSVGYGANFGGVSALLAMLNSCASNVSVVNIDNGFGAGYLAGIINHLE